jgi:hypothetical protein
MDVFYSGVWRPSKQDFFKHDPDGEYLVVGQGYDHTKTLIGEKNSGGTEILYDTGEYVLELISKIESGDLPRGKIYTASVHFVDFMEVTSYDELASALRKMDAIRKTGKIKYVDYERVATIWKEEFSSEPSIVPIDSFSIYQTLVAQTVDVCSQTAF